jgi:hypothetical protein
MGRQARLNALRQSEKRAENKLENQSNYNSSLR